jgi:lysine biosynthesis protein LysW
VWQHLSVVKPGQQSAAPNAKDARRVNSRETAGRDLCPLKIRIEWTPIGIINSLALIKEVGQMPRAICPDCDEDVFFSTKPRLGQIVYCSSCDARLEVVEVDPLELDWALEDSAEDLLEEDDDEHWDDDEEDE